MDLNTFRKKAFLFAFIAAIASLLFACLTFADDQIFDLLEASFSGLCTGFAFGLIVGDFSTGLLSSLIWASINSTKGVLDSSVFSLFKVKKN